MRKNLPVTQPEVKRPAGSRGLSTSDPDSRITYADAAFLQASGCALDEPTGQPHDIACHRHGHDGYLAHHQSSGVAQVIRRGRVEAGRRRDGSRFPMRLSVGASTGVAVHGPDGGTTDALLQAADEAMYANKRRRGATARRPGLP